MGVINDMWFSKNKFHKYILYEVGVLLNGKFCCMSPVTSQETPRDHQTMIQGMIQGKTHVKTHAWYVIRLKMDRLSIASGLSDLCFL